jgi:peptide deformylase
MAIREILIWPDPELLKVSQRIEAIDDEVKKLAADMLETMYDAEGVGLAAPQVGVHKRLVVIDIHSQDREEHEAEVPSGRDPLVLVNPEFVLKEGELSWEEGCLSVPGETGVVTRCAHVKVRYQDLDGNTHELEAEGLKAVALQHECDHLDGKLFVDYVSRLKRNVIRRKMERLRAEREEAA